MARKNRRALKFRHGSGTEIAYQLIKRNKGKVVTGEHIQKELERHGKGKNYHAVEYLVMKGVVKWLGRGQYTYIEDT